MRFTDLDFYCARQVENENEDENSLFCYMHSGDNVTIICTDTDLLNQK